MSEFPRILPAASHAPDRDIETAQLLMRGDQEGLRRLLVDHGGKVKSLLRKEFAKVLDLQEIDDVASQASVRVWRSSSTLDLARGTLGAWFFAIARNCARRLLENKKRFAPYSLIEDLDSAIAPPRRATGTGGEEGAEPAPNTLLQQVQECLQGLAPQQRAVLLADLAAGGAADTQALAEQLRTTSNSIYVARTNGRKALRSAMQKRGYGLPGSGSPSTGGWS